MIAWIVLLAGCNELPEYVTLSGRVLTAPSAEATDSDGALSSWWGWEGSAEEAPGVEGATVVTYDFGLVEVGRATTGEDGAFAVQARAASSIFVEMSAEGYRTTTIAGAMGWEDFQASDGTLWLADDGYVARVAEDFAGCPGADDPDGTLIEGEIRDWWPYGDGYLTHLVATGFVRAYDVDGNVYEPCYLADDENAVAYDPEAELTGYWGRFAFFDAPSGPVTLEAGYYVDPDNPDSAWTTLVYLYVAEGGVTPLYPVWVDPPV